MAETLRQLVSDVTGSPVYFVALLFVGTYPIVTALYWIAGALVFSRHRERSYDDDFYALTETLFVSVVVAAHNEEQTLDETLRSICALDWPRFEVLVVDDGSDDGTPEILRSWARAGTIRYLRKESNEGKALALDDALPLLHGELILVVDADGSPRPDVLRWMVPHFLRVPRLAALTGNPRVANTTTLLALLQAIEFSATVSVLRRAQATWGRLMTVSGICALIRRSALEEVGRFRPEMATEDIALTWQLESRFYDVRYEPRAVFSMEVPESLPAWWRQRVRWARGLSQVLRRHASVLGDRRRRRLWPVWIEAALSLLWCHLFLLGALLWVIGLTIGVYDFGSNPVPNFWGMLIVCVGLAQISLGLLLDNRYDEHMLRYLLWAPLYPLLYWALNAGTVVRGTVPGLLRRPDAPVTWSSRRHSG